MVRLGKSLDTEHWEWLGSLNIYLKISITAITHKYKSASTVCALLPDPLPITP